MAKKTPEMVQKVPRTALRRSGSKGGNEVLDQPEQCSNRDFDVGLDGVTVDANRPLAGVVLNFEVEVIDMGAPLPERSPTAMCPVVTTINRDSIIRPLPKQRHSFDSSREEPFYYIFSYIIRIVSG